MTKAEIVADVASRTNKTTDAALTRISGHVLRAYRRTLGKIGLLTVSRREFTLTCVAGVDQVLQDIEKVESIFDPLDSTPRKIYEVTLDEMKTRVPVDNFPSFYAIRRQHAHRLDIRLDAVMDAGYALTITGTESNAILGDDDEPDLPERFHDMLTEYAVWLELRKDEKVGAKDARATYDEMLGDLRLDLTLSTSRRIRVGENTLGRRTGRYPQGGFANLIR